MSISVLVLTKNEARNLPGCLASVAWSDDIHVLDSGSQDATVDVARGLGAHVTERPFDYFAAHQNWALEHLAFKHPWVFYIDADERVTGTLKDAIFEAVQNPGDRVAFRVQRRDFFLGTWLKHVQSSPYYLRLFRPEMMRYERMGHPVSLPAGPVGQVAGYLDHFPFSKGLRDWLDRHNRYSSEEAQQIVNDRRNNNTFSIRQALFCRDFHRRRVHQKELFYRLPNRPLFKFLLLFLLKRGFLDGRAGLTYALLQSIYEYMIVLKTRELEAASRTAAPGRPPPAGDPGPTARHQRKEIHDPTQS